MQTNTGPILFDGLQVRRRCTRLLKICQVGFRVLQQTATVVPQTEVATDDKGLARLAKTGKFPGAFLCHNAVDAVDR